MTEQKELDQKEPEQKLSSKEVKKLYYEKNKDKIREYGKKYYFDHHEERLEYSRKYRESHKEYFKQKVKDNYLNNKEEILKRRAVYYDCLCGSSVRVGDKSKHNKTQKHIKSLEPVPVA